MGKISMAIDALRGRISESDGYSDTITGRGLGNDRAGRPQGSGIRRSDEALLNLYKSNGGMQRVVNAPADDATRKGFRIITDDPTDNDELQKRWKELDLQAKFRDLVKFMQIYPQGAAAFIGLLSGDMTRQRDFSKPMPPDILAIDFVNSMNHPGDFTVQSIPVSDPTMREFGQVFFRIMGMAVHSSWVIWLAHEWDRKDNEGISRVNSVYDAMVAQDSALWSVSTMVQQLSMMIYTSTEFTKMSPEKKQLFGAKVRNYSETNSFWGIKENEKVDRLNYQFTGLKDILDFIFQNISLYSQIPQNILIGRAQGILTAAEEDTINYYSFIGQFQKSKLERLYRQMINLILLERRGELYRRHKGKLEYEIEFEPLWELSPSFKAELGKLNAERDLADVQSGKVSDSAELRARDDYYSMVDQNAEKEDEEIEPKTNRESSSTQSSNPKDKKATNDVVISEESMLLNSATSDGDVVGLDEIENAIRRSQGEWDMLIPLDAKEEKKLYGNDVIETTGSQVRVRIASPGNFESGSFRTITISKKKGISAVIGRPKGQTGTKIQSYRFDKKKWSEKEAGAWVRSKGFKPV